MTSNFNLVKFPLIEIGGLSVGGLNFSKSSDGGKTFRSLQAGLAHVDNHAIWINPANSLHLLIGNDGGLLPAPARVDHVDLAPAERAALEAIESCRTPVGRIRPDLQLGRSIFQTRRKPYPRHSAGVDGD